MKLSELVARLRELFGRQPLPIFAPAPAPPLMTTLETREDASRKVDVAICAYGKPFQTAVTLASLFEHSGHHIDKIFFQQELEQPHGSAVHFIPDCFPDRKIVNFKPPLHLGIKFTDTSRLNEDDYRQSIRYQYAWEKSENDYLFLCHNDNLFTSDIIGGMLTRLYDGSYTGVGAIGQCWNCPAHFGSACNGDIYEKYNPTYEEVLELLAKHPGPRTNPYNVSKTQPMPLPECRLNEFGCLINLRVLRPLVSPCGAIEPFGTLSIDIGTDWFRKLVLSGHRFLNWYEGMSHAWFSDNGNGSSADTQINIYDASEKRASDYLRTRYPALSERLRSRLDHYHATLLEPQVSPSKPARYAILFKSHFWDDYVQRQLDRLKMSVGSGDVYVLVSGSGAVKSKIEHPADRIICVTDASAEAIGLSHINQFPMFWYHKDYPLHIFSRLFPDYDFYAMTEYDVVVNASFDFIIEEMARLDADFVAEPLREPLDTWIWRTSCSGSFPEERICGYLVNLAIFSNRAAHMLYERRVRECERMRLERTAVLPFCEAAIPTELSLAGLKLVPLSKFGSTSSYDWYPPLREETLADLAMAAFIHPLVSRASVEPSS